MSKPNFPSYQVRVSPKAKRVNLTISEVGELNIVVPVGFDHRKIPEILLSKQKWIETTTAKVKAERALLCQNAKVLPQEVNLIAIGESWQVQYTNHSEFLIRELDHNQLLVSDHYPKIRHTLSQWLIGKATNYLIPQLRLVSQETSLPFCQASVRQQKSLWASCSSRRNISLNRNLLFLPPDVVHYVFIHELCHTRHMNHSSDFWTLVGSYVPNYAHLDTQLNQSRLFVPAWADISTMNL